MGKLAQKKETVQDLQQQLGQATVVVVADYRGLTVADLTVLRKALRKENAFFTVAKNTLTNHAIQDSDKKGIESYLKGPTALLIGTGDQVTPVKTLVKFLADNKKPNKLRGGCMDGNQLSAADVEQLAKLPPIEELRGKLVGAINSPLSGIVSAISSPQRGLVNVLDQYAKKLQG